MKKKRRKHDPVYSDLDKGKVFAFCEPVWAIPLGKWHIRRLTSKGYKLGGGADTDSLCGRKMGWDLEVTITEFHLENGTCSHCRERFEEIKKT